MQTSADTVANSEKTFAVVGVCYLARVKGLGFRVKGLGFRVKD